MPTLPQDLQDKLNQAESDFLVALADDNDHAVSVQTLASAQAAETHAKNVAADAHKAAAQSANDALAALKAHFGLDAPDNPPPTVPPTTPPTL